MPARFVIRREYESAGFICGIPLKGNFTTMRTLVIGLLTLLASTPGRSSTPVDENLYTTYTVGDNSQSIGYVVCGSTEEAFGCFASGSIEPFGRVGAFIQGKASPSGDVVTREIYVIDVESGTDRNGVTLSEWKKTDTVSASSDSVELTFIRSVSLPLTGGHKANCYLVGTNSFLYVGTDQGAIAVQVRKSNLELNPIGGVGGNSISGITVTDEDYVAISYGGPNELGASFQSFDPAGSLSAVGGGYSVFLNSRIGLPTFDIPIANNATAMTPVLHPLDGRLAAAAPASSATATPVTLYTYYSFESESQLAPAFNWVDFVDCGSTVRSSGCFGSGTLGPFGNVGTALVGRQSVAGDTLARHIYVLDTVTGKDKYQVKLYDYLKTDVYDPATDSVTVSEKLEKTVMLPLTGGPKARAFMQASGDYIYVATSASDGALVQVHTGSLAVDQVGGFSPPAPLNSITSDDYGYVSIVSFGKLDSGFYLFDAKGQVDSLGGGVAYLLNSLVGINANSLPP